MAIKYVKVKRMISTGQNPGEKYLARIFRDQDVMIEQIANDISGSTTVSYPDVLACLKAMEIHVAKYVTAGQAVKFGLFEEACHLCGNCVLGETGGICPITRCAKSLVNGPCGGSKNGKCEVNPENDCAWIAIYKRLEQQGRLDNLSKTRADKGYEDVAYPRTINIRG